MNRTALRFFIIFAGLFLASNILTAQMGGFTVTIVVNAPNATIFVDNNPISGNVVRLPSGVHSFRVTAPGYQQYVLNTTILANYTINAQLRPLGFSLTIQTNVGGAAIFVDGTQISGNVIIVTPGGHTVRVTADGYNDFNTTVNIVNAPMVVNVPLVLAGYTLTVNANVQGASVQIDGALAGQTPFAQVFPVGTHNVTVSAPGYISFGTSVSLTAPIVVNAQLQQSLATLNFTFPRGFLDPNNKDAAGLIRIFIDGRLVGQGRDFSGIQIAPGVHRIFVQSGGLFVQGGDYAFSPGVSYTIELFMELRVRAQQ
jgi:hypothetical protein